MRSRRRSVLITSLSISGTRVGSAGCLAERPIAHELLGMRVCLDGRGHCPTACGAESPGRADRANIQVKYGSESIARSLTLDLQILLLPILYSMLGAGVWLLRDHQVQVSERRLRPVQLGEYAQRILLGAVPFTRRTI